MAIKKIFSTVNSEEPVKTGKGAKRVGSCASNDGLTFEDLSWLHHKHAFNAWIWLLNKEIYKPGGWSLNVPSRTLFLYILSDYLHNPLDSSRYLSFVLSTTHLPRILYAISIQRLVTSFFIGSKCIVDDGQKVNLHINLMSSNIIKM